MSALLAMPCVLGTATAVAEPALPVWRSRPVGGGVAFYRRHTEAILHRYLRTALDLGRSPSVVANIVFRGRASNCRIRSFEDALIFVLDVEKCLRRLNHLEQSLVARIALEDYSVLEAAAITGESLRSVGRIYGTALDRLTQMFLEYGLLDSDLENLSRGQAKNLSNDPT